MDYLTKPVSPPIVLARVRNHLALRAMEVFLREQNVELQAARVAADAASLAKTTFLSSMSHELRSPLNAILGFAQLLETDAPPPTPEQRESITQILKAGWHLLALINEILDLAKVESGQVPLSLECVVMAELVKECLGMLEPTLRERGLSIVAPDVAGLPEVYADPTKVKQILINLLSNAIKYNRPGGVIELTGEVSPPGRVRTSVRDTGVGLSADQLGELFVAFHRLGQENGQEEGTGIGLVVSKRLVERMGGAIGARSGRKVARSARRVTWGAVAKTAPTSIRSTMATVTGRRTGLSAWQARTRRTPSGSRRISTRTA